MRYRAEYGMEQVEEMNVAVGKGEDKVAVDLVTAVVEPVVGWEEFAVGYQIWAWVVVAEGKVAFVVDTGMIVVDKVAVCTGVALGNWSIAVDKV